MWFQFQFQSTVYSMMLCINNCNVRRDLLLLFIDTWHWHQHQAWNYPITLWLQLQPHSWHFNVVIIAYCLHVRASCMYVCIVGVTPLIFPCFFIIFEPYMHLSLLLTLNILTTPLLHLLLLHTLSLVYIIVRVYLDYFRSYHGTLQTAWHGARITEIIVMIFKRA